ncbi:MAG: archaeosine biosynthesis radical SAM protein RaSEA [Candidatus Lokiarchaeia archaeon]|nr:archaeosine biosynthesis radical SAM protein RaSEA [Candidatus Lokiarchaeia archaeon]
MNELNYPFENNRSLVEKINFIKQKALRKKAIYSEEQLKHPISYWTKKERLRDKIGKEFTIILRSKGCSWASSTNGGCSMCGYYLDAVNNRVSSSQLISQFDYAFYDKLNEIKKDTYNYILKIFNSGSFLDENEISYDFRKHIYENINKVEKIKEVVIESRIDYITSEILVELKEGFKKKYLEIAIGLESVNGYIRNNYINKGVLFKDFKSVVKKCKENDIGVKVYLLFKPPFLNEQAAIDDCSYSIKKLINLGVNSISINPTNVQKGTLVEYLWFQNRYRPPWYYSLFKSIRNSVSQEDLNNVRLLSDPSGAGTKRGIHNCLKKECETYAREKLKNFVLSQNLDELEQKEFKCNCKKKYNLKKNYV